MLCPYCQQDLECLAAGCLRCRGCQRHWQQTSPDATRHQRPLWSGRQLLFLQGLISGLVFGAAFALLAVLAF